MSTTGQNFVLTGGTGSYLSGAGVVTAPFVLGLDGGSAQDACNAAPPSGSGVASGFANNSATPIDRVMFDFAMTAVPPGIGTNILTFGTYVGAFAKNGAIYVTFTGTTAVSIDLTNLSNSVGVTFSQVGDTSLATINALVVRNLSAVASTITIAPGGANPSRFPSLAGTTPTLALLANDIFCQSSALGLVVDSTHKVITFTPTVGGSMALAYGGA
jgi:hypothetical protein